MSDYQFDPNSTRFAAPGTTANVYVSGLPERYNDYQLRVLFEQFGKVESAKMMCYSANSSKPRGTGFVLFDNTESPVAAVKALNKSLLEGQTIEVCFAKAHNGQSRAPKPKHQAPPPMPQQVLQQQPNATATVIGGGFQVQGYDNPVTFQPAPTVQPTLVVPGPSKIQQQPPQYTQQPQQQPNVVVVQQVVQPDGQIVYLVPTGPVMTAVPQPQQQ